MDAYRHIYFIIFTTTKTSFVGAHIINKPCLKLVPCLNRA